MKMSNVESSGKSCISSLKDLDNLLKCGICYEYLNTTLITPCSHNYCSYCIRKSLMYKPQCPSCFEETTDSQLRSNRVLDEIVAIFSSVKDTLIRGFTNAQYVKNICEKTSVSTETRDERSSSVNPVNRRSNQLPVVIEQTSENTLCSNNNNNATTHNTPKKDVRIPSIFSLSPRKLRATNVDIPKVPCPVCSVEIPERSINSHLDACLKRSQEKCAPKNEGIKPLPKLVYTLVKEKDLRKKLLDLGLSSVGDRNTLINRHKRYTLLYNSNCDSLNPKPVSEIIKQLKAEEDEEKKVTSQSVPVMKLNVDRRADPKVNEEAQRQYLEEHKSSFQKLIESIQRNKQMRKDKNKIDIVDKNDEVSVSDASKQKEIKVISIDETTSSSETSEVEPVINFVSMSKRKRILSDNEESSEEVREVSSSGEEFKTEASVHCPREKEKSSPSKTKYKKSSKNAKSSKMSISNDTSSSDNSNEDLMPLAEKLENISSDSSSFICNKGNVTPTNSTPSKASTSFSSPVFGSRSRVNTTPSTKPFREKEIRREGTPDIFQDEQIICKPEETNEEFFLDCDCSNDSESLMVYQEPECLKEDVFQMSPVLDSESEIVKQDLSFSLGIDSILPETEDFMQTPVRRQSTRRRGKTTDLVEPSRRSLRKRAKK